jgi:uncharacterized RDD family membrane protein YckC
VTSWDDTAPPAWDDAPVAAEPHYAGFWIRVLANILDGLIVGVPLSIIFAIAGDEGNASSQGLQTLIMALYAIVLWVNWGRTIGARILGLRLVRVDGQPVTYGTAIIRYLMIIVSAIPLGLGLIWVAFDRRKQGWMDKVAGTYVIRD